MSKLSKSKKIFKKIIQFLIFTQFEKDGPKNIPKEKKINLPRSNESTEAYFYTRYSIQLQRLNFLQIINFLFTPRNEINRSTSVNLKSSTEPLLVEKKDLKRLRRLGRGSFGEVVEMIHEPSNNIFAVKVKCLNVLLFVHFKV